MKVFASLQGTLSLFLCGCGCVCIFPLKITGAWTIISLVFIFFETKCIRVSIYYSQFFYFAHLESAHWSIYDRYFHREITKTANEAFHSVTQRVAIHLARANCAPMSCKRFHCICFSSRSKVNKRNGFLKRKKKETIFIFCEYHRTLLFHFKWYSIK